MSLPADNYQVGCKEGFGFTEYMIQPENRVPPFDFIYRLYEVLYATMKM